MKLFNSGGKKKTSNDQKPDDKDDMKDEGKQRED